MRMAKATNKAGEASQMKVKPGSQQGSKTVLLIRIACCRVLFSEDTLPNPSCLHWYLANFWNQKCTTTFAYTLYTRCANRRL